MSDTVQVMCYKQGSMVADSWTARVLTIDRRTGTLTISRRGHPSNVFYHAMKPSVAQQRSDCDQFALLSSGCPGKSTPTLLLLGEEAEVPDLAAEEMALVGIPVPSTALTDGSYEPDAAVLATPYMLAAGDPAAKKRRVQPKESDRWVLGFPSKASYFVAVQMLRSMESVRFARNC